MKIIRKSRRELLIGLAALLVLGLLAYLISDCSVSSTFATSFGALAAGLGVIVALVTFRQSQQANRWTGLVAVHSRFNEQESYAARSYLFGDFQRDLGQGAKYVLGEDSVDGDGHVKIKWVLKELEKNGEVEKQLNSELSKIKSPIAGMSALAAAERVLLDFDLIAVLFCEGDDTAYAIGHAYEPALRKTSESLLSLIAIKTKLRGPQSYKYHYLKMLHDLGIPLQGLSIPKRP